MNRVARRGTRLGTWPRRVEVVAATALVSVMCGGSAHGRPAAQRAGPTPDVYFAPTRHAVVEEMLTLAGVGPEDVVYDLGSGDGRIVVLAAQRHGARGVGVEIDPRLVAISRRVAEEAEVADRVTFVLGSMFEAAISDATVITLYLSPGANRRLESKLRRELRPGTRIVSHQFRIGRWRPTKTLRASDGTDLFLWVVPGG